MPTTISLTPSAPPRLMICSSAGISRFAAIEAEALGAGIALVQEALEASRLDQLLQDRRLPSRVKATPCRGPRCAPAASLLGGVGDVHELDAERAAIGALQDVEHLVDGRAFEAEHVVDEDRAVAVFRPKP
jgi:hypothetical protein